MEMTTKVTCKSDRPEMRFVWLDLETTGLDCAKHKILEVFCRVTDADLKPVGDGKGVGFVVRRTQEELDASQPFSIEHFGAPGGLFGECLDSKISKPENEVEAGLVEYIKEHTQGPEYSYLSGRSVHFDRGFLNVSMPKVLECMWHVHCDVSCVSLLTRAWNRALWNEIDACRSPPATRFVVFFSFSFLEKKRSGTTRRRRYDP